VFSCSKIEQKQLNTWVSFQSAEQPLLGQFSVSGNRLFVFQFLAGLRSITFAFLLVFSHFAHLSEYAGIGTLACAIFHKLIIRRRRPEAVHFFLKRRDGFG
jgi:hypothetical protein